MFEMLFYAGLVKVPLYILGTVLESRLSRYRINVIPRPDDISMYALNNT